ncbi:hypothetical protein SRHO_G00189540 [Serrasalmus rhombeus]
MLERSNPILYSGCQYALQCEDAHYLSADPPQRLHLRPHSLVNNRAGRRVRACHRCDSISCRPAQKKSAQKTYAPVESKSNQVLLRLDPWLFRFKEIAQVPLENLSAAESPVTVK